MYALCQELTSKPLVFWFVGWDPNLISVWKTHVCYALKCEGCWNADNSEANGHRNIGATALYCDVSDETMRNEWN
jgi:hypothetical protein